LILRAALLSTVALGFLAGLATSADAYWRRTSYFGRGGWYGGYYGHHVRAVHGGYRAAEPKKDVGFGDIPKGPLQIVVNISTQKVTLYSNGERVAQGPVSTGMPGHPTPRGVFSIIEKDRYHHSNLYSGAPMPYMQRITWSGVALHEGVLPGHPASHGCIRTSHDFAQKLWPITKLGVRFLVTTSEVAPADFRHPKLFVPLQKPSEATVAVNGATEGRSAGMPIKLADNAPAAEGAAARAAPPAVTTELRKSVEIPTAGEPGAASPGAAQPAEGPAADDLSKPAPTIDPLKPLVPWRAKSDQPIKHAGQVAVFVSRKEKKIFVRQGMVPIFDMPVEIDDPDQPLGLHVFTALEVAEDGAGMRWNLMTVPTDGSIDEDYRSRSRRRAAKEPPPRVVNLKAPSTAAEALDRIHMPKQVVDRVSELLIPGSSLVISDQGLGRETGRGTEFIVLTR
jgi:hypothetical protein